MVGIRYVSSHIRSLFVVILALMVLLAGCVPAALPLATAPKVFSATEAVPANEQASRVEVIEVEVVDNPHRFVFGEAPVYEDGMPAYGNVFITQGYIYPKGTLNGSNGVLPNGEPEFPDKVIGTWFCRGWFIGDGAYTETGAMAITTQVFEFGEAYDNATIVTEGYEVVDVNKPFERAITGGTGRYMGARGEAIQELLGFNEDMAVNLRFEIRVSQ